MSNFYIIKKSEQLLDFHLFLDISSNPKQSATMVVDDKGFVKVDVEVVCFGKLQIFLKNSTISLSGPPSNKCFLSLGL